MESGCHHGIWLSSWNLNIKLVIVMSQPKHDDANTQQPIFCPITY